MKFQFTSAIINSLNVVICKVKLESVHTYNSDCYQDIARNNLLLNVNG